MKASEQTWYAFECSLPVHNGASIVLDMRLEEKTDNPPGIACPLCHAAMDHVGIWPATENGFGGMSDHLDNVLRYARGAADLHGDALPACKNLAQAIDALDAALHAKWHAKNA